MRPLITPKYWLLAATLLLLAVALVALWHSTQTLITVMHTERHVHVSPPPTIPALMPTAPTDAPVPQEPAPPVTPNTAEAPPKETVSVAKAEPPADPVVISDNRLWTFTAGYLEGVEDGLLHFGGGVGLAYVDGTWLTGGRADIAFNAGDQEATTITIPDQATLRLGNDTMDIEGGCVVQSANGQVTSISADHITINRSLTNAAPAAATP